MQQFHRAVVTIYCHWIGGGGLTWSLPSSLICKAHAEASFHRAPCKIPLQWHQQSQCGPIRLEDQSVNRPRDSAVKQVIHRVRGLKHDVLPLCSRAVHSSASAADDSHGIPHISSLSIFSASAEIASRDDHTRSAFFAYFKDSVSFWCFFVALAAFTRQTKQNAKTLIC